MNSSWPNFFIIGAAKSGTTSLYQTLSQHPDVYFPFDKEPMFFSREDMYERGWAWYLKTYFAKAADQPLRGEATPHYLYWSEKVAPRIAEQYQDSPPKLIVILRDPATRAYSWYWNMVREGLDNRSFEDALAEEEEKLREHQDLLWQQGSMRYGYFRGGCYATLLQPFLKAFSREQILFLLQEDLSRDFQQTMRQVTEFLGLAEHEFQPVRSNPASMPKSRLLQSVTSPPGAVKRMIKSAGFLLPWAIKVRDKILKVNLKAVEYPPLKPETEQALRARYREEISELEKILQRDLSHWVQPKVKAAE